MDRLDKFSIGAIFVLAAFCAYIAVFALLSYSRQEAENAGHEAVGHYYSPQELQQKTELAKRLLANNNLEQAREFISGMVADYPYAGVPFMMMGDLFMREQKPVKAMLEYKKGVDLNPDFLDKKTQLFQGKKIKNNLDEVQSILEKRLEANPDNGEWKEMREVLYYMRRKVAGSCG